MACGIRPLQEGLVPLLAATFAYLLGGGGGFHSIPVPSSPKPSLTPLYQIAPSRTLAWSPTLMILRCWPLLPASWRLRQGTNQSQYVSVIWGQASKVSSGSGRRPCDYGWNVNNNVLQPTWFEGPAFPSSLFKINDAAEANVMGGESSMTMTKLQLLLLISNMDFDQDDPDELVLLIDPEDEQWSEVSDFDHKNDMEH